jgi:hypothetical protein
MAEAASGTDDVWMYQLTENEMALEKSPPKSTKYYKGDELK